MTFDFILPDLGEGIQEGVLIRWLVQPGDRVAVDQPFAVIETDKAVVELPAPQAGVVVSLHFKPGETIRVGQALITFDDGLAEARVTRPEAMSLQVDISRASTPEASPAQMGATSKKTLRVLATPHTRAYARKRGIDLAEVTPTGKGGRVRDEDVDRAISEREGVTSPSASSEQTVPPQAKTAPLVTPLPSADHGDEPVEFLPVSHLRKVIAQNMLLSKQRSAHVTHVDEADVTELYRLYQKARKHTQEQQSIKLTILPFFLKAIVLTLKNHPLLNASYDEETDRLILKKYYHFGMAVDTPEGLIVPVIKHVDRKDISQLAVEIGSLANKAVERTLGLSEIKGATFTVTNIGPIGGLFATPIIHQPELAILGLHTIKERPAVVDGAVVPRKMIYLTISFDHRFIDGAEAARFMTELVELIQNPELLFMRMI